MSENMVQVADSLLRFVRIDKRLIHLDLSQTNLSEQMILNIIPGIKKSRSLMAVHFSGNPGVTKRLKEEAKSILKAKVVVARPALNLQRCLSQATLKKYSQLFMQESIKIKQLNNLKRIVQNGATDDKYFSPDQKLIFSRYLLHKKEIPLSG